MTMQEKNSKHTSIRKLKKELSEIDNDKKKKKALYDAKE